MPTTDATLRTSRAGSSRPSSRAPSTARSVSGRRGAPGSTSTIRPSRNSSVPSSIEARTVSPMNSGLPWVRSWIRRASPASRAARATIVASCAVSAGARPPRSTRSTCPSAAQSGIVPGRVVARMTKRPDGGGLDEQLDHPAARCIEPVEVVEDDDPRTVRVEHALDVRGRDLAQDRGDLGRVVRDVDLLRLPARERRVPGDRRDRTAVAAQRRLVGARREQQLAGVAPRVDARARRRWPGRRAARSGTARRDRRRRSRSRSRHSPSPRASLSRSATRRDLPIPASPVIRTTAPRPDRRARFSVRRTRPISDARPTSGFSGVARWAPRPVSPDCPVSEKSRTTDDCPRSTTEPRSSTVRRSRPPRTVASSSRISPGRASAWIRAAVVIASPVTARSPVPSPRAAATTSPVARPIRTSSGSPPSSGSSSIARISSAARAARTGSSSWAWGQPKTAKTASPMNFSRVPSSRSMVSPIRPSAVPTRTRTSSGSCSASIRT